MILLSQKQIFAHPDMYTFRMVLPLKITLGHLSCDEIPKIDYAWVNFRKVSEGVWIITDFEPSTLTLQEVIEAIENQK